MECGICGKEFELKKEKKYLIRKSGLSVLIDKNNLEAFDCPYCGCQNVVNERYGQQSPFIDNEADEKLLSEPHGTE